jgi:hypothetical protein
VSAFSSMSKSRAARPIRNCLASNISSVLGPPSLSPIARASGASTPCTRLTAVLTTCAARCECCEVVEAQLLVDALLHHEGFESFAVDAAAAVLPDPVRVCVRLCPTKSTQERSQDGRQVRTCIARN